MKRRRQEVLREVVVNNNQALAAATYEADPAGRPVVHQRVFDTLGLLERNGSITNDMRLAGEKFRHAFRIAGLDPLHAADLTRVKGSAGAAPAPTVNQQAARRAVQAALDALGGMDSPAGSAVWHVVGEEQSIREWSNRETLAGRRYSDKTAAGILIGALSGLVGHYGLGRSIQRRAS